MDAPKPAIRFCINNPRTLAERQGLIERGIPSRDCLGNCTVCFEGRFLEIDGEIVAGDSYEQILEVGMGVGDTKAKKIPRENHGAEESSNG